MNKHSINSKEWFKRIIETFPDAIVVTDLKGIIIECNQAALDISVFNSKEELIGFNGLNAIYPDDRERIKKDTKNLLLNGVIKDTEYKILNREGRVFPIEISASVIFDEKGNPDAFVCILKDISNRKNTENALKDAYDNLEIKVKERTKELEEAYEALSESEERYRLTFENSRDAINVFSIDRRILDVNKKLIQLSGYSKEELLSMKLKDIFVEGNSKDSSRRIKNLLEGKEIPIFEANLVTKENKIIAVEIGVTRLINSYGEDVVFVGNIRDITERKIAEKEIKERSEKLNILNKIIITANRSGSVQSLLKDVLEQTLNLLPFDGGEIYLINKKMGTAKVFHSKGTSDSFKTLKINEQPHRLIYINGKSAFRSDLDKYALNISTESDSQSIAIVPIFSEGEIIGSLSLASKEKHYFTDEEKELIRSIGNEIGNVIGKLKAEEEMEKLIEELKRSNEELEQFAYITSHDLQEPLRTIASFTQLLERRYKNQLDSDADEFMDYIVDASIRMKQMIQGLLEYSRIGKGGLEFKPVNLDKVLKEVYSNLKAVIDKNDAELIWKELPEPIGDSKLLVQLFQNLIGNAIKFRKPDETPKIHISFLHNKNGYKDVFFVEDNGIGIELQFSDRIFKVFKRLHTIDQYKGTGIGLATCKRIVEHHGGHIWVESELNKGSRFYFTLKA